MTETNIGLEDIAAISTAEEGRASALALYNRLPRWIEITDDPATWPPIDKWVIVRSDNHEYPASRVIEGNYMTCANGFYAAIRNESIVTHWRPI